MTFICRQYTLVKRKNHVRTLKVDDDGPPLCKKKKRKLQENTPKRSLLRYPKTASNKIPIQNGEGTSQTTPRWNYGGDLRVRVSLMFNSFPRVLDRRLFPRQQETDDSGNKYKIYYIFYLYQLDGQERSGRPSGMSYFEDVLSWMAF